MIGGLAGQAKYLNIKPDRAKLMMSDLDKNSYEVIDVRTANEFAAGHIKGARNYNLYDVDFRKKIARLDPAKTYFLICRSGNRSTSACKNMAKSGFKNLYNISGGMTAWK